MSRYIESLAELRAEVQSWLTLLDDPFKAPELKVGLPTRVASAAFESAVQYECVRRGAV